ncbi:hypothetical protein KY321_02435, partial [Candidatus Woesearchaeota archaeon]|nr:hypothetical protein [Candidatus Woesearchaeota archaeon]
GRVRETSYLLLVFTPVIYGVVNLTMKYVLTIIIFAPLFYFFFEIIDKKIPNIIHEEADGSSSHSEEDFKF